MENKLELKLTNARIKDITPPDTGRDTYHDTEQRALKLLVGFSGIKAFYIRTNFNGKTIFRKLGRFPDITTEQARKKASNYLSSINDGIDPKTSEKAKESKKTTIRQCLEDYTTTRSSLKESTANSYKRHLEIYVADWMDRPLLEINRDKIEQRHSRIGKKSPSAANKVMRVLRALYEYAHGKYEDEQGNPIILHNPVKRLNYAKAWFKETRRSSYLKPANIRPWYNVVTSTPEWLDCADPKLIRDYLLLILFTGLRRREAAGLRWEWVDLTHKTLTIPETKNGHPQILPLSDFLLELLQDRHKDKGDSDYVFPGSGKSGHFVEPKKSISNIRNRCKTLVLAHPFSNINETNFTLHDLRRTFITVAESLGIRDYTLKRLLNHRSSGDVTDGYIVSDVERLRYPMQQITDHILLLAKPQDNVLTFPNIGNKKA